MLKKTTKAIATPIATGEYTAVFVSMRDGKTPADTCLTFRLTEQDRLINAFVNNARVIFKDEKSGEEFTSEDFFFQGLKRQLKMYGEDVDPMEVLNACAENPITLWIISDEKYTNVYASKPKAYDGAELGL